LEGNTSSNNDQLIYIVTADDVTLSDTEHLVVIVNDGRVRTGCADEANALGVGSQLAGPFTAHGVTRVEHGSAYVIKMLTLDQFLKIIVIKPGIERNMAMSSKAICEGPSSPIEIPAWDPTQLILVCEIAPIRSWNKTNK